MLKIGMAIYYEANIYSLPNFLGGTNFKNSYVQYYFLSFSAKSVVYSFQS